MGNLLKIMLPVCMLFIPGLWITQGWTGEPNEAVGLPIIFSTLGILVILFVLLMVGSASGTAEGKPVKKWVLKILTKIGMY